VITIDDYLHSMQTTFVPERTRGRCAVLQYVFTGSQCGTCHAAIDDGTLAVARGAHPAPTATMYCDFDLFLRMLAYEEDALLAFQAGTFRVEGDVETLMQSDTWFVRPVRW
jgi:putative sterol carrier protein